MALTITHAKVNAIANWTQADLNIQIALGFYPPGTTIAQITQPSDWNAAHPYTGRLDLANLSTLVGLSVLGNSSTITGQMAAITAINSKNYLSYDGSQLVWDGIDLDDGNATYGTLDVPRGGSDASTGQDAFLSWFNFDPLGDTGTYDKESRVVMYNKTPGGASEAIALRLDNYASTIITTTQGTINSGFAAGIIPRARALSTKTANYTIVDADGTILVDCTSGNVTITLPTAVGRSAKEFKIKRIDGTTNTVTIATTSSQTIDGSTTKLIPFQFWEYTLQSDNANWRIVDSYTPAVKGNATLVGGSVAVTINGLTTNDFAYGNIVTPGGTIGTGGHKYVCTANTLTITSVIITGSTQALDTSVLRYNIIPA